ncbi:MAG: hypothetical protein K6C68_01750 [Ruminococcus sp.]|nr:hypothetical protein [Ruminococcus sp.]
MDRTCENTVTGRKRALTEKGGLKVFRDGQWHEPDLNSIFDGEPVPCTVGDIIYARDDFYAAGTAADGRATLHSSLTGELWTPVNYYRAALLGRRHNAEGRCRQALL